MALFSAKIVKIEATFLKSLAEMRGPVEPFDVQRGGGGKIPQGHFHPRIFGTEKYTTVCSYDFSWYH